MLVLVLAWCAVSPAVAAGRTYTVEETPAEIHKTYPYRVVSDSFVLYLSQEDLDSVDKDAYYDGMNRFLEYLEEDFSEAKEYLKDYLKEEVPPIRIYTYFSKPSSSFAGLYLGRDQGIMLYVDWATASYGILHEYIHYLTLDCFRYSVADGFWTEGIAEFVSSLVCGNKTARAFNYAFDAEDEADLAARGYTDEDGKIDMRKYKHGAAASWEMPYSIGCQYGSVTGRTMTMTARVQQHPTMDQLTYAQAACFIEYLIDRFGKDKVIKHMNCNATQFRGLYGRSFEDLCCQWKQENLNKYAEFDPDLQPDGQE